MSYRRLNLQDFKDVWTAADISHIEDGVINNETELGAIKSTVTNMESQLKDLTDSEVLNSIMPLWHTLLSNGGEKIFPPTISFDGNIIGKVFLPINSGIGEIGAGYVRIGDDVGFTVGAMTCGGLYHVVSAVVPAMLNVNLLDETEINGSVGTNLLQALFVEGEESYDYGDNPVVIYNSMYQNMFTEFVLSNNFLSMFFGEEDSSLTLPTAFSIDRSFEYNGCIYPSGFYSLYIHFNFFKNLNGAQGAMIPDLPLIYVDKFWAFGYQEFFIDSILKQLNMPLDYSKASNAFECLGDSIFWNNINSLKTDVIIPSDHQLSMFKCMSYNPQAFLEACLSSTKITIFDKNGNSEDLTMDIVPINSEKSEKAYKTSVFALGNYIIIVPTIAQLNKENCVIPGVYCSPMAPSSFQLQFHGVDVEKLFNKYKINHQYLPETPKFDLIEMGMPVIQLNGEPSILEMDTTKLYFDSQKGPVRLKVQTTLGQVSYLANFTELGTFCQSVFSTYYTVEGSMVKFDVVTVFDDSMISIQAIPVS